jgi:FkbM family methyltransferase
MLRAASGLRGKRAVLELVAGRGNESQRTIAVPMKALGGQDLFVRPGTSDAYNATWYYLDALHRPPPGLDGPLETVWEIGSNIGAALTALGTEYPDAGLLGLEPDPDNAAVLRKNVARFGSRCEIVEKGVWDEVGELVIDDSSPSGSHGLATRLPQADDEDRQSVAVTTLDALLDEYLRADQVDYLHVSVEGAEPRVFSVGDWHKRVRSLRVELHHNYADFTFADCERMLTERGYQVTPDPQHPDKWANAVRR